MKTSSRVGIVFLTGIVSYCLYVPVAQAETRTTDEYIAIDFEAETFTSSDERWVLTEPGTAQTSPDPDPNHSDLAIGNAYLEVLPDIRVTHDDPTSPPVAFWSNPGIGPTLEYTVDFPEAGRYHVHVRALSTGTEDNGIYVGLNDDWPASGLRLQFCTAGQGWRWSSRQRDSGSNGPCGVEKTIWLDVANPGINTVKFSAREDGFEIDHVMLIKDRSENTRVCSPINENEIRCVNGSVDGADSAADMSVDLESSRSNGLIGDIFELTATLTNFDRFDDAENVSLNLDADLGNAWEMVDADSRCLAQGNDVVCDLGNVAPTEPDGQLIVPIQLRAITAGARTLTATVSTSNIDTNTENNAEEISVDIEKLIEYATAQTTASWERDTVYVLEPVELTIAVKNTGTSDLENVDVILELPDDVDVTQLPAECTVIPKLQCSIGNVSPGETSKFAIGLESDMAGVHPLTMTTQAANLEQGSLYKLIRINVLPVDENPEPDTDGDPDESNAMDQTEQADNSGSLGLFALFVLLSITAIRRQIMLINRSPVRTVNRPGSGN